MMLRCSTFVALLIFCAPVMADSIDVNLNNNTAQFQYIAPVGYSEEGKAELHAGFLYDNKNNVLGDLGLLVMSDLSKSSNTSLGVGLKTVAALSGDFSLALALGGKIRSTPFANRRIGLVGLVYVAPKIVSFGGADFFVHGGVSVEYEIIKHAIAYVGYRNIRFGVENSPDMLDEKNAHLGVRISF